MSAAIQLDRMVTYKEALLRIASYSHLKTYEVT